MSAPGAPSVLERGLGRLSGLALRGPWTANGRIVVQGVFGFLMQLTRSRRLGLRSAPPIPKAERVGDGGTR